jgi:NAD(P)-dependent dehydrogenase (short-subunit alcohol dehydrogenase family)
LVTGASSGIGEACALHLDKLGFQVFAGVRQKAAGLSLQSRASDRLTPVMLDVTDAESIAAAVEMIQAATGGVLHGLVNNAGIVIAGPLEYIPVEEVRRQLEVNVVGQVAVTQAVLPLLRRAQGRIVNIGSISGRSALPFMGPYAASKFALEAITDALRVELRPWRIRVSIIEPGAVATPIWERSVAAAEESLKNLPPRVQELYGPVLTMMRESAMKSARDGIPAATVARAVVHALTARRPKTRYVMGQGARALLVLERLPDGWRDWLIARNLPRYGDNEPGA